MTKQNTVLEFPQGVVKTFGDFKEVLNKQFSNMVKHDLFVTDVSKDDLWDMYLNSFPEGSNPIYKERTEHDCQCCKQFIRACGNVVAVVNGALVSIWDVEIDGPYHVVANALSNFVKSKAIRDIYLHRENHLGTDFNHQDKGGEIVKWSHFHFKLPNKFVNSDKASALAKKRSNKEVFMRSLNEITIEASETVLELIDQNSLYRGEEHKSIVELFVKYKKEFNQITSPKNQELYCWVTSLALGNAAKIRNTVIGTLLTDISDNIELDKAVKAFEAKVAPENYKRPTALITQGMINKAQEKVAELGIEDSLQRRYAVTDDITINNVLFADRSVKKSMGVFDELSNEVKVDVNKFDKVEEVTIESFIKDILPKATSLELLFENKHNSNLMSLIAPINSDSPNILKWNNNFSWAYNGEVADSMKERVKNAGGDVTGDLRFSIQWNDQDDNNDDLDAHCKEPKELISYSHMRSGSSGGVLDVDITQPNHKIAVENITWSNRCKMPIGDYKMLVHCYSGRNARSGFTAQIEFDGVIHDFSCDKPLRKNQKIDVAVVNWDGDKFTLNPVLQSSSMAKTVWGVTTQKFHTVNMLMSSPNHWDEQATGNKHWFFVMDDCNNEEKARGFFNEFLKPELIEHRKVFEVLGSKMKAEKSDAQLSGLGFSSTQRNSVLCKVTGSFSRTIQINF